MEGKNDGVFSPKSAIKNPDNKPFKNVKGSVPVFVTDEDGKEYDGLDNPNPSSQGDLPPLQKSPNSIASQNVRMGGSGAPGANTMNPNAQKEPNSEAKEASLQATPLGNMSRNIRASMGTTGSSTYGRSSTRELSETPQTKLYEMRWCFIALVINCLLVYFVKALSMGLESPISITLVTSVGTVVVELILLLANIITLRALDDGASAYFGYQLASRRGYSLAVCGFLHGNLFDKLAFASQLSLTSTCRKLLSRASMVWGFMYIILWLTPLSATALVGEASREDIGTISCIYYEQDGNPTDRRWPTPEVQTGIAELMFGSVLGKLRSEKNVSYTTAIIAPQVFGALNDGDTMIGPGFTLDISTSCVCAHTSNVAGIVSSGVDTATATALASRISELGRGFGLATALVKNGTTFHAISSLTGTIICGGSNQTVPTIPVCTTKFSNHNKANVLVSYMSDGTTASITPRSAKVREITEVADVETWAYSAMENILGGQSSAISLPPTIPGVLNPLGWWTTSNLLAVDATYIESGIEAMYAVLFRAGVQRTYSSDGTACVRNVEQDHASVLTLEEYGYITAIVILAIQLFSTAVGFAGFVPWFQSTAPIGPAVRLTKDPVYFTMMVNGCSVVNGAETLCNAPRHVIWEALDIVVRVGESLSTRDDPMQGQITLDRPKVVTAFTNGKRYI